MRRHTPVSSVTFTPAPRTDIRRGLLGWVRFRIGDDWQVDGVALRRTRSGRLAISYPCRLDRSKHEHPYVLPVDARVRRQVELALLAELEREGNP